MPPRPQDTHDALVDARHNRRRYVLMMQGRDIADDADADSRGVASAQVGRLAGGQPPV